LNTAVKAARRQRRAAFVCCRWQSSGDAIARTGEKFTAMNTTMRRAGAGRARSGLTVVEVLVALVIVTVGLLGMAGSTALALRTTMDAARRRDAAQRAASRIAFLAAQGCAVASSGISSASGAPFTEQWVVRSRAGGFMTVVDTVRWSSARGSRSYSLGSAIQC
ncbi:MAG: hypothetical protein ABJA80_04860, partial [bacterium]